LKVDVTTVDLIGEPWAVNGNMEKVIQVLETRGTILGFYPDAEANNVLHVCFGHAAGYFGPVGAPLIPAIPAVAATPGDPLAVPPIPPTAAVPEVPEVPEVPGASATAEEAVAPATETTVTLLNGADKPLGELAKAIQELPGGFLETVTLTVGHGFKVATYPATAPVVP
jgi:hypothetical protein